jgi:hypothetical protein
LQITRVNGLNVGADRAGNQRRRGQRGAGDSLNEFTAVHVLAFHYLFV